MKKRKVVKNVDFLLSNKHYRQLHLTLYFASMTIIVLTYFITIILFSKMVNLILTSVVSFVIGLYIVLNRDKIVKTISDYLEEKKRKKIRSENQMGLRATLNRLSPKRKRINLQIKNNDGFFDKIRNTKIKFKFSNKKEKEDKYYEIK